MIGPAHPETESGTGIWLGTPSDPPGEPGAAVWSAELRRDDVAFGGLAEEWEELYARCPTATPFQSYGWLESWWREYGVPGRLRLALVRQDGVLVGAAPLMLARRGPWRVLVPLGRDQSDYHDVLLDARCPAEAAARLAAVLRADAGWHVLDIAEVRSGAAAEQLHRDWPGPRWRTRGSTCLEIRAGSVEDFLDRLPRPTAKKLRGKLRRIAATGIDERRVRAADVEPAIAALLRLHEEQWRGRQINPEHLRPRFARHLARAVTRMVERGQAELAEYRMDGRTVIADLDVVGHDFVGTYLAGFEPGLRRRIDVAVLMLSSALATAERRGQPVLSLLRGDEPYKMRWHPVPARNARLLLAGQAGPRPVTAGYAALVRARTAVADAARHRAPWLRSARRQVRAHTGRPWRAR